MGRLSRAVALFHAVSVIDYSYFLSIHLRERYYRAAHSALLDQHGSRCHHNARGRAPDSGCAWVDTAQQLIAISERIHVILLGGGNLVDTSAVHPWVLGARLQAFFHFVTTRSTGAWSSHWACTRSVLFNYQRQLASLPSS